MLVFPKALNAQEVIPVITPPTKSELIQKVYQYADQYDVKASTMLAIINCENTDWDPTLQSRIINKGQREESYGLSQINLPTHPTITKEQATNPDFSLDFMASQLSKGNKNIWTCARRLS